MSTWNCCRLCLGVRTLHPIFQMPEHHERYTEIINNATGIKVDLNDNLPQTLCTSCINFINDSYKFRKKCSETQKLLQNKESFQVKIESIFDSETLKAESDRVESIDISDFIDDITLFNDNDVLNDQDSDCNYINDSELHIQETDSTEVKVKKVRKPVKRKVKESGDKKERAKEEIECEYCHKILTSKFSLRNHYKIHTGFDVVCEHCGKKFITKRLLLMHCRAKHGYEKTDKCSYCDYKASNAEQVKIHERLHTGEKPYSCGECGASFHRKSSYLQHVAIHLPDKTVQCSQCPARFKSVTLMRIHRSRHSAARYTFSCRVCRRSFARRRNVARHLQRVHQLQPDPDHVVRAKVA